MVKVLELVQEQVPEVVPIDRGLFAGTIPLGYLSPVIGGVYQRLGKQDGFPGIDFRNWNVIHAWAEAVGSNLQERI
jgi:hypothetical protein